MIVCYRSVDGLLIEAAAFGFVPVSFLFHTIAKRTVAEWCASDRVQDGIKISDLANKHNTVQRFCTNMGAIKACNAAK